MKKQETPTVKESKQLESEGTTFMKPPAFGLSDGDGGAKERSVPSHQGFEGIPYADEIASWPGEVVMVHSPCYSQEIEEIALNASFHPEMYEAAAIAMDAKIAECLHRRFQNAEGKENDWADRKLNGSVKMNAENFAATSNGKKSWPKLVIMTFWNDPSNPEKGGYNYSHVVYFPIAAMFPKEYREFLPGGTVFVGDGGGTTAKPDLSHDAKYVDYNEWLPVFHDAVGKLAGMKGDPKSLTNNLPVWVQRLQKLAEDAERITSKVRETGKAVGDNLSERDAEAKEEAEKYVEIDGQKYERGKVYTFQTFDPKTNQSGSVTCKPEFYLEVHYKNGSRLRPSSSAVK
jgi:hypothetical protein